MKEIYLDNSATTRISDGALSKMNEVMREHWGNPSSLHARGLDAERVMREARERILLSLGVRRSTQGQLIFTSGGTESNVLAVSGVAHAKERRGTIMITAGEHASVENTAARLEKEGFEIVRIPTANGVLDLDLIEETCKTKKVILASFMHVNNETGALYDLPRAFSLIRRLSPGVVTHADCVQSYMKVRFTPETLSADLVSISSHKINGPKGIGALYVSETVLKAKNLSPVLTGGGQENGFRSGTENVYAIAGFGEAAMEHAKTLDADIARLTELRDAFEDAAARAGCEIHRPAGGRAPHILNIAVPNIKSETVLNDLSAHGICVSSGSACSSHASHLSHALLAFGLTKEDADSSIRVSLCVDNTEEEAEALGAALADALSRLAKIRR